MLKLLAFVMSWSVFAQAAPATLHIEKETTIEQFQDWLIEAAKGAAPVQFEFSNLEKSFNPFPHILDTPELSKTRGDIYFLIGDLTNSWSEEEYASYFPIARWLSIQGFRAIINPAAYIKDIREAVKAEDTRGIIWSSHGSEDGEIFDKADIALPRHIFTNDASDGLKHFVLGDCYGSLVASYYTFPQDSGVHYWTGEITSDVFFDYLKSAKWRREFFKDLKLKPKKKQHK